KASVAPFGEGCGRSTEQERQARPGLPLSFQGGWCLRAGLILATGSSSRAASRMSKSTIVAAPVFLNQPGYFVASSYKVARLSALYSVAAGNLPKRRRLADCSDIEHLRIGADGGGLWVGGRSCRTQVFNTLRSRPDGCILPRWRRHAPRTV